jgi:hypothetical protein
MSEFIKKDVFMEEDMSEFMGEYLSEFMEQSEDYDKAKLLWALYYYLTEEYDRRVCTGHPNLNGNAMPANGYEKRLITRHATQIYQRVKFLLINLPEEDVENAKRMMSGFSHDQICEYLKQTSWEEEYSWIRDGR